MNKKLLLTLGAAVAASTPVFAVVSCSLFSGDSEDGRSNLEFYNYEDYINDDDADPSEGTSAAILDSRYHYQTFGDLPEFETYIKQERTIGGVGSDYFNASLAQRGLIRKIDFSKVFDMPGDKSLWETELQKIYTPEAWKILNSFALTNDEGSNDIDGDGIDDQLWEYMIPYFSQNKVLAFNPFDDEFANAPADVLATLQGTDQAAIQALFGGDLSYSNILTKMHEWGASRFVNNDYMRDNMMIGSESLNGDTTGHVDSVAQGRQYLDAYKTMLHDTGMRVSDVQTSGTETLRSLLRINGHQPTSSVGFMYNGDALYGYYGGDIDGAVDGELRIVTPENSTYLLDGVVMAANTTADLDVQDRFYDTIKEALFKGAQTSYSGYAGFTSSDNMVYNNFDYVNYTPSYTNVHEFIEDKTDGYFVDEGDFDEVAYNIAMSTRNASGTDQANIDDGHLAQVIDHGWTSELSTYNSQNIALKS